LKLALTLLVTSILLLFVGISNVLACSCAQGTVEEHFQKAETIFIGKVTSIYGPINERYQKTAIYDDSSLNEEASQGQNYVLPVRVKFKVAEVLKGSPSKTSYIKTGYGDGDCGVVFHVDTQYVFFVLSGGTTNICTGTRYYHPKNKESLEYVKKINELAAKEIKKL
jgi:hypothetical protein